MEALEVSLGQRHGIARCHAVDQRRPRENFHACFCSSGTVVATSRSMAVSIEQASPTEAHELPSLDTYECGFVRLVTYSRRVVKVGVAGDLEHAADGVDRSRAEERRPGLGVLVVAAAAFVFGFAFVLPLELLLLHSSSSPLFRLARVRPAPDLNAVVVTSSSASSSDSFSLSLAFVSCSSSEYHGDIRNESKALARFTDAAPERWCCCCSLSRCM